MSRFALPDLARAFRDGERFGQASVRVAEVARLMLPTGRIVACDPGYLRSVHSREPAFTRAIPPGTYPVLLALLGHPAVPFERVACAMVRFQEVPAERWEMALHPGWDPSALKPGFHFGYGVDGGTGCFLDEWTATLIPVEQPAYDEAMRRLSGLEAIQEVQRLLVPPAFGELMASLFFITMNERGGSPARSAVLDPATGANIVCFSSGVGDGCYASYFGLAADGSAASLVTDFGLLVLSVPCTLEIPVPVRKHSELTHPDLAEVGIDHIRVDWERTRGEIVVDIGETLYVQDVRFENRADSPARCIAVGGSRRWWFRLDEPLRPTARVLIEYTLRTEAM